MKGGKGASYFWTFDNSRSGNRSGRILGLELTTPQVVDVKQLSFRRRIWKMSFEASIVVPKSKSEQGARTSQNIMEVRKLRLIW